MFKSYYYKSWGSYKYKRSLSVILVLNCFKESVYKKMMNYS